MNEIKFNSDDLAERDRDDVVASNSLQEVVEDSKDTLFGYDGVSLVGLSNDDLLGNFALSGETGYGKSALLLNMAFQNIQDGDNVYFIDTKGTESEELYKRAQGCREGDVSKVDMSEFNLMEARSSLDNFEVVIFDLSRVHHDIVGDVCSSVVDMIERKVADSEERYHLFVDDFSRHSNDREDRFKSLFNAENLGLYVSFQNPRQLDEKSRETVKRNVDNIFSLRVNEELSGEFFEDFGFSEEDFFDLDLYEFLDLSTGEVYLSLPPLVVDED